MAKINYRQCSLKNGNTKTVSWLPEKYAKEGNYLRLKGSEGKWTNGWLVESVGDTRVDDSSLPDSHVRIKSHRKATGDAIPKN